MAGQTLEGSSVSEQTKRGKPEGLENHSTVHELAVMLGVSDRTIERWAKSGRLPEPAHTTDKGWKLWSPSQARAALDRVMEERA